jgi:hypothetical protein
MNYFSIHANTDRLGAKQPFGLRAQSCSPTREQTLAGRLPR